MPIGIIGFLKRAWWTLKSVKNISLFIIDCVGGITSRDLIYQTRNGIKMTVRAGTTDKAEVVLIFSDKEYPKKYFSEIRKPVVVDIGAHVGCFSCYVSQEIGKNHPRVYSIEPSKENYDYLKKNKVLNKLDYKCFNLAISNYNGVGKLDISTTSDAFHLSTKVKDQEKKNQQECTCVTLDAFCRSQNISKVDLLKIDCEGEEYKIFRKSLKFLREKVKYIFAEVHDINDKDNYLEFENFVKKNNFSIVGKMFPTVVFLKNLNF